MAQAACAPARREFLRALDTALKQSSALSTGSIFPYTAVSAAPCPDNSLSSPDLSHQNT